MSKHIGKVTIDNCRFNIYNSLQPGETIACEEDHIEGTYTVPDWNAVETLKELKVPKGAKVQYGAEPNYPQPVEKTPIPKEILDLAAKLYMEDLRGSDGSEG